MSVDGDYSYSTEESVPAPEIDGFVDLVQVGAGGFSTVYSGFQTAMNRRVAIKVLNISGPNRRQFEHECKALGPLTGTRGVVPILQAAYTTDGRPCIVMQLMVSSLAERIDRYGPATSAEVISLGSVIADALGAAHKLGISHRDVKPENILIGPDGSVAIADFGIATIEDIAAASQLESALSPPHAAPERFTTGGSTAPISASDVYSLGSTLYFALSGRPPFGTAASGGLAGLMTRIISSPIPPLSRSDLPPGLEDVLRRAMAKDPAERYPSCVELATALRSLDPAGSQRTETRSAEGGSAGNETSVGATTGTSSATPRPSEPTSATSARPSADSHTSASSGLGSATVLNPLPDAPPAKSEPPAPRSRRLAIVLGSLATVVVLCGGLVVYALATDPGTRKQPKTTATRPTPKPPEFASDGVGLRPDGVLVISGENPNTDPAFKDSVVRWELRKKGSDDIIAFDLLAVSLTEDNSQFDDPRGPQGPVDYFAKNLGLDADTTYCVVLRLRAGIDDPKVLASSEERCTDGTTIDRSG